MPEEKATAAAPELLVEQQKKISQEQTHSSTQKLVEQIAHLQKILADDNKSVTHNTVEEPLADSDKSEVDKTSSFSVKPVTQSQSQQVEELQTRIQYALAESANKEAEKLLNQLLSIKPTHSKARQMLANLYNTNGKYAEAQQVLQQGLVLNRDDVDVRVMLARFFTQQNHADAALELLEAYLPDIHTHIPYFALKASIADALARFDVALKTYQSLVAIQPQNSKWWLGVAISADRQSQFELAKKAYQNVLRYGHQSDSVSAFATKRLSQLRGE
nr:tetratricopeptide repeat protein [Neptunicella marina]